MPVPETRLINTASPLMGGGDLSIDRTHEIAITPANDGGAIAKQATSPGAAQTGHFNIDTGIGRLAVQDKGGQVWNVKAFGAKGDTKTVNDGAITIGTPNFTSPTAAFVAGDVGKVITVRGAGASADATLVTTILAFVSGTEVTLAANAGTTVSAAITNWGTDDTTAIQNTINALPPSGGIVFLPQGDYMITAMLTLGNATSTAISTRNAIQFIGIGTGVNASNLLPSSGAPSGGTRLVWGSPIAGTLLQMLGPVEGVVVGDLALDCNAIAVTGLDCLRIFQCITRNVLIENWAAGYAIKLRADSPFTGGSGGGAPTNNLFDTVVCIKPFSMSSSNGLLVGPGAGNVSNNTFLNCKWFRGNSTTSIGINLANAGDNYFVGCLSTRDGLVVPEGIGLQIDTSGALTPGNNMFFATAIGGGVALSGSWPLTRYPAAIFLPYSTNDSEPIPPNGANGILLPQFMCAGISDLGYPFGQFASTGLLGSIVSSSATLTNSVTTEQAFNKSFAFPGRFLAGGQVVRIKGGGRVSTDVAAAVNITMAVRFGTNHIRNIVFSPAGGLVNAGWDIQVEFIVRGGPEAAATIQRGYGSLAMRSDASSSSSSNLTGTFTVDLRVAQTVDVTAAFNNLSGADSITMDYFTIELATGNTSF